MMVKSCINFSTSSIHTPLMLSLLNSLQMIGHVFLNSSGFHLCGNRSDWLLFINLDKQVISKKTFFSALSWHKHYSFSMLYSIKPFSLVIATVIPVHFSKIASQILSVISFIDIAARPCKDTVSMFLVLNVLSLVFVTISRTFFPHSMSFPQSVPETSLKIAAIRPIIFSVSMWLPLRILSLVQISICELLGSLSVLQAGLEVALITVTVYPDMNAIAFGLAHPPFADITVSLDTAPHA